MTPTTDSSGWLNASRRARDLAALESDPHVDVLVIGGGVTGTGVALDAATRGLRVLLVERADLAAGTSRWSSKLVHGGLRYLASGAVGIAHESAVERDVLMRTIAPHLIKPLAQVVPLTDAIGTRDALITRLGFLAGDALRITARTPSSVLARSRRISAAEVIDLAPTVRNNDLRGGLLNWDGQLNDDARLVLGIARTAASHGATILTYCRADEVTGSSARITDTRSSAALTVHARAVINATGVWTGTVDSSVRLRPSRGTHLVFDQDTFGGLRAGLTVPVPGEFSRYVFALPQPDDRVYLGLTDEEAPGEIPDEPAATDAEIDFLLETVNNALRTPLTRADIRGTYAGLRPLLDAGNGSTADVSRKHAVLTRGDKLVTVVGGKLTTYRRMAQDAVDAALAATGIDAGPCRTRELALVGADPSGSATGDVDPRLIDKYGAEASAITELVAGNPALTNPVAPGTSITEAELIFGILAEGALTVDDLLARRTRLSLTPAVAEQARPVAEAVLAEYAPNN